MQDVHNNAKTMINAMRGVFSGPAEGEECPSKEEGSGSRASAMTPRTPADQLAPGVPLPSSISCSSASGPSTGKKSLSETLRQGSVAGATKGRARRSTPSQCLAPSWCRTRVHSLRQPTLSSRRRSQPSLRRLWTPRRERACCTRWPCVVRPWLPFGTLRPG